MKSVLFVDDEPSILGGLKTALRKRRAHWDMAFAESGEAALDLLAQQPRDVVVSDMRMPGMDGAELLGRVRERYPRTARLILSGHAHREDLIRARPFAQQILSKPCDRGALCDAIERVFKVQALLSNEHIHSLVGRLDRLPLRPTSYQDLSRALSDPRRSVEKLVGIVERDPALSVMVLSVVNAGYFGAAPATVSIPQAVERLGFDLLSAFALSTDMFSRVDSSLLKSKTLANLPHISLLKARLAKQFVPDPALAEEAFAAALLLDIGYVVLAHDGAESYLSLLERAEAEGRPLHEMEQEQLGFTHAEVSAYLLGIWGLPARIVELVASHPLPASVDLAHSPVAAAVHVADVLVEGIRQGASDISAGIAASIREQPEMQARLANWRSLAHTTMGVA